MFHVPEPPAFILSPRPRGCFHCSLKTSLCARLAGPDWYDHLLLVMLGLRSILRDDSGFSASKALADFVFVQGPGSFKKVFHPADGDQNTISLDCLKPIQSPDPVSQQPPCQGLPPRTAPILGPVPAPIPVLPAVPLRGNPPRRARPATSFLCLEDDAGGGAPVAVLKAVLP